MDCRTKWHGEFCMHPVTMSRSHYIFTSKELHGLLRKDVIILNDISVTLRMDNCPFPRGVEDRGDRLPKDFLSYYMIDTVSGRSSISRLPG
ncbi:hypothetical protein AVEN_239031-1 [Araneus ventricosus]|uniref:Uncharacterized protein n=1 Tax=Araneus ventricosus TaxID=182803 RepID=A0A4Y2M4H0_ARAVE|nr:hypothetical protein AVEN_239031-1 [Araneus ventricosus]